MTQDLGARFEDFAARKTREAATARIERLTTVVQRTGNGLERGIGNAWTRAHYGGDFEIVAPREGQTAVSLVFVQSRDRNTGGAEPAALGGGATDLHLIYEGLSRVAADAVLAGAATVQLETLYSVWHPELVALRLALGLPRHPAQVVISKHGRVNFEALLFNVPGIPVYLIAGEDCLSRCAEWLAARPWVRPVLLIEDRLKAAIDHLREVEGIRRISAIGGRFTASRLVDAGLAHDLYLTTTPRDGGEPHTPWYSGAAQPRLDVLAKKQWIAAGEAVTFEHLSITSPQSSSSRSSRLLKRT